MRRVRSRSIQRDAQRWRYDARLRASVPRLLLIPRNPKKKCYLLARFCAAFGGTPSEYLRVAGRSLGVEDPRLFLVGIDLNLAGAAATAGLAVFYGASGAFNGFNLDLYKAYYGRDDEYIQARYELWKEMNSWERDNG